MTQGPGSSPHDILGIPATAGLNEIRQAYRRGALKYHPDNFHQSPLEAEKRFRELAKAYKAALRAHIPEYKEGDSSKPYSPVDFARMDTEWHREGIGERYVNENVAEWTMRDIAKSRSVATVDENKLFIKAWAAATIIGIVVMLLVGLIGPAGDNGREMEMSDILVGEITALAVWALVIAGAIWGIVLTRKTIWLTLQLGVRLLPFLPAARKAALLTGKTSRKN